jgi:hypothetical protein
MSFSVRVAARLAALAAAPVAALALQAAPAGADGPVVGFPPDDPCAPVGPLCDPLPPCQPIAPGPRAVTVDLSFAPCDEPFATDRSADSPAAQAVVRSWKAVTS